MRDEEVAKVEAGNQEQGIERVEASLIPHPASLPIFYDEQKTRWPRLRRIAAVCLLLGVVGVITLIVSIVAPALLPRNPVATRYCGARIGQSRPDSIPL